ncbi:wax ester/triacylglycerol synthase domain-containing protein [Prescottella sp. R16]|uniref:wax ester/triacylglycerol synthase domain-containing protein n=1 Tax=Prescottella sp. R16 TaxID=3064529 RepID=UPI00272DE931|nr:wax ester/triacylglycerol synthase domain-containing protein [Prescottella sp. R16]
MSLSDRLTAGCVTLAPRDADFVYQEHDGHPGHLFAVYLFDATGRPDVEFTHEQARKWTAERLGHHRVFTHAVGRVPLGLEHPYWQPVPVELDEHVHVTAVEGSGWAALHDHVDRLVSARMDLTRPPWELHFLTGLEGLKGLPDRVTAVVFKAHHSAGDGLAVLELARRLFTADARPATPVTPAPLLPARMLVDSLCSLPGQLLRFARAVPGNRAAAGAVDEARDAGLWEAEAEQPSTRFNGKVSGRAVSASTTFSTSRIRRIRAAVPDATVNDVLLAVVGAGLADYLADTGTPHRGSLVAMVPRSMRQVEEEASANRLAIMSVDMHTGVPDPVARLTRIAGSSRSEKVRTAHPVVCRQAAAVQTAPPPLMRLIAYGHKNNDRDLNRPRYQHTMVSNMPFTVDGLTLDGAPAVAVIGGQPPVDGDGLRHFVVAATGDRLTLTVVADAASMPDPGRYLDLIRMRLDELETAATTTFAGAQEA